MSVIRSIIIDDQPSFRRSLKSILQENYPEVVITGEAGSVHEGTLLIKTARPDLIFLDIEMPGGTGIDLLRNFREPSFEVIFVTAHDHFAIQAIRLSALDYLLKPVDLDELKGAIEKYKDRRNSQEKLNNLAIMLENIDSPALGSKKIILSTHTGLEIVRLGEIIRCESDSGYTTFYLNNGSWITVSKTLKSFTMELQCLGFLRVHASHLINTEYIRKIKKGKQYEVEMTDGSIVEVSRSKRDELLQVLSLS